MNSLTRTALVGAATVFCAPSTANAQSTNPLTNYQNAINSTLVPNNKGQITANALNQALSKLTPVITSICSSFDSGGNCVLSPIVPASKLPAPTPTTLGGVKSGAGAAHQYQIGIDTTGSPLFAQPSGADLQPNSVSPGQLAAGAAIGNLGFTPINPSPAPPAWGTNYGNYFGGIVNVGNLPSASMGGGGSGATPAALIGAIDIPANDIGTFLDTGISGYARNASPLSGGVGVFGGGMAGADGTASAGISGWGLNSICTNAPTIAAQNNVGHDYFSCKSAELDVNALKLPNGNTPHGTFIGLDIEGGSNVQPIGGSYGITIGTFSNNNSTPGALLPWTIPLVIGSQPSQFGIQIGDTSTTNAVNSSSQRLGFLSVQSSGTQVTSSIYADSNGNLTLSPYGGTNGTQNFLTDGNSNIILSTSPFGVTANRPVTVNNGTQSTSPITGALIDSGGLGVAGNTYIQGLLSIGGALQAASLPTSGGTVKGTVCVDQTGAVYVKTTTGACL